MKTYYLKIASKEELDTWEQQEAIIGMANALGKNYAVVKLFPEEQIKECTSTYYRKKVENGT
jgi:hypothetical protein